MNVSDNYDVFGAGAPPDDYIAVRATSSDTTDIDIDIDIDYMEASSHDPLPSIPSSYAGIGAARKLYVHEGSATAPANVHSMQRCAHINREGRGQCKKHALPGSIFCQKHIHVSSTAGPRGNYEYDSSSTDHDYLEPTGAATTLSLNGENDDLENYDPVTAVAAQFDNPVFDENQAVISQDPIVTDGPALPLKAVSRVIRRSKHSNPADHSKRRTRWEDQHSWVPPNTRGDDATRLNRQIKVLACVSGVALVTAVIAVAIAIGAIVEVKSLASCTCDGTSRAGSEPTTGNFTGPLAETIAAPPTLDPSTSPTVAVPSASPSFLPTSGPSRAPSAEPTKTPTNKPTVQPTPEPTTKPTLAPSGRPTVTPDSTQVPLGGILLWSGTIQDIPDGFSICDGASINGVRTPDLRNKFVIGSSGADSKGYPVTTITGKQSQSGGEQGRHPAVSHTFS